MTEPCCIAAAHGQACTCKRPDFWPAVPSGDYHEGIEDGWKAGTAQERRIWRMAIEQYFDGTAVEDVEKYVEEIRKGVEGE